MKNIGQTKICSIFENLSPLSAFIVLQLLEQNLLIVPIDFKSIKSPQSHSFPNAAKWHKNRSTCKWTSYAPLNYAVIR